MERIHPNAPGLRLHCWVESKLAAVPPNTLHLRPYPNEIYLEPSGRLRYTLFPTKVTICRHLVQEGFGLLQSPENLGKGAGRGHSFVQCLADAIYWWGNTGCVARA